MAIDCLRYYFDYFFVMLITAFFGFASCQTFVTVGLTVAATAIINATYFLCPFAIKLEALVYPALLEFVTFTFVLFPIAASAVGQLVHLASFSLTTLNHFLGSLETQKLHSSWELAELAPTLHYSLEVVLAASSSPEFYFPTIGLICSNICIMRPDPSLI